MGPGMADVIDGESRLLTTDAVRGLNADVGGVGEHAAAVAAAWLRQSARRDCGGHPGRLSTTATASARTSGRRPAAAVAAGRRARLRRYRGASARPARGGWRLVLLVVWVVVTLLSPWARRVTDRVDAALLRASRSCVGLADRCVPAIDRVALAGR